MKEAQRIKKKTKLIEELAITPLIETACRKVGIGRSTFYRWLEEDEAFELAAEMAIAQGRDRINDMAESQLIKGISNGEYKFIKYWLDNNHKNYVFRKPVKRIKRPFKSLISRMLTTDWGDDTW